MKVLSVIGLNDFGVSFQKGIESTSAGEYLGTFDQAYFAERYGFRACGVARSVLQKRLRDEAARQDIPIHQDWELQDLQQSADGVKATSTDGREVSASFAIGCDGLHAVTRKLVLQKHSMSELAADSTGLVMVSTPIPRFHNAADDLKIGGFSPKARGLTPGCPSSWYGEAKFALTYEIDDRNAIWGVCLPAPEEKENWQAADDLEEQKAALLEDLKDWPQPIRETIAGTEKLVKFGLYDRPALDSEHWYYSRCVLVGDAAHPTSPHYGQGANQSLEDCWHLSQLLPDAGGDLSTESLTTAFRMYAQKRQPRTAALVKAARAQGQMRVMRGKEACQQRNAKVKQMWADEAAVRERMHALCKEPF